jgi:hypothetical protein
MKKGYEQMFNSQITLDSQLEEFKFKSRLAKNQEYETTKQEVLD